MSTGVPLKSALQSQTRYAGKVDETRTIAHAAQCCLQTLNNCIGIAEDLGPKELSLIQHQVVRFSLWLSSIGVFALDRASIDYRLRDCSDTHRLVKSLVQVLNGHLQKCIPRLQTWKNLKAAASDDLNQQMKIVSMELEMAVKQAAKDISLLHQLSNIIRRAGHVSQNSKANVFFEIKDADGNKIEKHFEAIVLQDLTNKFPRCNEQLRQRLASTVLLRPKRILYRRSRRPMTPPTWLHIAAEPDLCSKKIQSVNSSQAGTTETSTTLDPEKLQRLTAPSALLMEECISSNIHDDLGFPPPPRAAIQDRFRELKASRLARHNARLLEIPYFQIYVAQQGKPSSLDAEIVSNLRAQIREAERDLQIGLDADLKMCKNMKGEVICPYCLCALSSTDMKFKEKWRHHLLGDLDAYVCLFEDCDKPSELYNQSDAWLKHMREHALRWQCMASFHGPQTFDQREAYEDHLREVHEGIFTEAQILAMTEAKARKRVPLFLSCPLCGVTADHHTVVGSLEDHIVKHLRYLALSSLPYIKEEDQNTRSTLSFGSDDGAIPANRSRIFDFLGEEADTAFDGQNMEIIRPQLVHSDQDPYAAWGGIQSYVRASHKPRPGEPPEQTKRFLSNTFLCPEIPGSRNDDEPYPQQCDDSARFVDDHDIPAGLYEKRSTQWGWIPKITIPYEGQDADPILQGFRRRAISRTLAEKATTRGDSSATASGSTPVRQEILQKFKSATIFPVDMPPFVPIDAIIDVLDVETILTALVEASCESVGSEKCDYIAENLLRVFATLLFIGNPQAILEFEFRGFTDDVFPLACANTNPEGNEKEGLGWYRTIHPFTGDPNDDLHPVSRCFENPSLWTLDKFEHFYASQWLFSAPVFGTDKFEYLLAPQSPLPLTTLTSHQAGGVLCSQVYMASIHPAHLSSQTTMELDLRRSAVAVKIFELKTKVDNETRVDNFVTRPDVVAFAQMFKAFLEECDVLYAMYTISHAHILKPIAAFTRGEQCGYIMPRARGSLRDFWERQDPSRVGSNQMISWLFKQLLGITDGLAKLHEHHYDNKPLTRHGALTPDNILWFPSQESDMDMNSMGLLVIGDPGRTKFYTKDASGDRIARLRYTARERPPSPFHDTWSLGLIFFEFIIWLIRGKQEVEKFRSQTANVHVSNEDDRKFDKWARLLMADESCLHGTPLGELVLFIVRKVLVWQRECSQNEGRARAVEFSQWIEQVRLVVNASGSSYTTVQPKLHRLAFKRPEEGVDIISSASNEQESGVVGNSSRKGSEGKVSNFKFWRRLKKQGK
ncbi:hypothetical protein J7T55_010421 [Diaporthe amygdali]|uniref:uncharacterized protein n=1 Tax=Phomopsis amygdali TaxID=1214568 RepID=UPI0022FF12B9|nr:uncharacterized protein J7T55_010421 [Diaporthe amygdali]KAJ0115598.1 hypothetical protein J7T55_010421 [Diaporthe amygdali]